MVTMLWCQEVSKMHTGDTKLYRDVDVINKVRRNHVYNCVFVLGDIILWIHCERFVWEWVVWWVHMYNGRGSKQLQHLRHILSRLVQVFLLLSRAKVPLIDEYSITKKVSKLIFLYTNIFSRMTWNKTTSFIGSIKMKHRLQNTR